MNAYNKVGEPLFQDGLALAIPQERRVSVYGADCNSLIEGESFEDTLNGQTQIYFTTTALALLISATTGNVPTLWNPSTSGKIFIPKKLICTYLSGTTTIGSVALAVTAAQPGSTVIATTGPIITFTDVAPVNGGLGATNAKARGMLWAPAVCTFFAAPTKFMGTEINMGAVAPTNGGNSFVHRFNGELILNPGQALSVVYTVTTSTSLWFVTLIGIEKTLPAMR